MKNQETCSCDGGAQVLTGVQDAKGALTPTVIHASVRGVRHLHS